MSVPMVSLPEAAMRLGLNYREAYDAALRGELGAAERRGSRIYVPADAVERQRGLQDQKRQPPPTAIAR